MVEGGTALRRAQCRGGSNSSNRSRCRLASDQRRIRCAIWINVFRATRADVITTSGNSLPVRCRSQALPSRRRRRMLFTLLCMQDQMSSDRQPSLRSRAGLVWCLQTDHPTRPSSFTNRVERAHRRHAAPALEIETRPEGIAEGQPTDMFLRSRLPASWSMRSRSFRSVRDHVLVVAFGLSCLAASVRGFRYRGDERSV
jgi:hypothetical protein